MSIKYNKYLASNWWKSLRERRLKRNRWCEACGSNRNLQIHHYNYEYKYSGTPSKAIKHTKVLCSSCHQGFHIRFGVKLDMTEEMISFIRETKKEIAESKKMFNEIREIDRWISNI